MVSYIFYSDGGPSPSHAFGAGPNPLPAEAGERETLRLLSRFSGEKEGTALQSASEARWEDEGLAGKFITAS